MKYETASGEEVVLHVIGRSGKIAQLMLQMNCVRER